MELNKILKEFSQETGLKVKTAADLEIEDKKNGETSPNFITYKDNSTLDENFQPPTNDELLAELNKFFSSDEENFSYNPADNSAQVDDKEEKQVAQPTDDVSVFVPMSSEEFENAVNPASKPQSVSSSTVNQAQKKYANEKISLPNFPNLANYLNSLDIEIVAKTYLQPANHGTSVCPHCGAGTHGHHNTGANIDRKRNKLHCFSCGIDFSVMDLICFCEGLNNRGKDFIRAMKIACDIFNISDAQSFVHEKISAQIKPATSNETSKEKFHYSRIDEARNNLKKFFDDNGGTFRAIPYADYSRAKAGYLPDLYFNKLKSKHPAMIFENDIGGIFGRAVDVDGKENISNTFTTSLKVPTADIEKSIVLIVESVIDALSILYATKWEVNVIATGGINGLQALRQSLKRLFPAEKPNLILMLDNDDKDGRNAGQNAAADWIRTLREENFVVVNRVLTDEKNVDPNTFLISYGVDALRTRIKKILTTAQIELEKARAEISDRKETVADENSLYDEREISIYDFFNFEFDKCVAEFKKYAHRKTDFKNFDEIQRLLPGLYIIGALPGVGKTTFSWQLANQIAELNQRDNVDEDVIFISYEMSRLAMFAKTLSRFLYLKDKSTNLTATDIICGGTSSTMQEVLQTIRKTTKNRRFSMFELHEPDIDELIKKISPHCKNEKSPVVVIDYLQIVPPTSNEKTDDRKGNIDNTLRQLKKFQLQTNATIFVISSLNRDSYNRVELNLDSFSGSSGIEYTADVIFGMELFDFKEGNTN